LLRWVKMKELQLAVDRRGGKEHGEQEGREGGRLTRRLFGGEVSAVGKEGGRSYN